MSRIRQLVLSMLIALLAPLAQAQEESGLVELMGDMQRYAHKLQLAIDHHNAELAGFYAHELEEVIEATTGIEEYDGHAIGSLTSAMLSPVFGSLEGTLDSEGMPEASQAFDAMLDACNGCHQATGHGFIVIRRNPENPYLQSFESGD